MKEIWQRLGKGAITAISVCMLFLDLFILLRLGVSMLEERKYYRVK